MRPFLALLLAAALTPAHSQTVTGPGAPLGGLPGALPGVEPALAEAYAAFSKGEPELGGLNITPIAAALQSQEFVEKARKLEALSASGRAEEAKVVRSELRGTVYWALAHAERARTEAVRAEARRLAPRPPGSIPRDGVVVNDVTALNPVVVDRVETPTRIEEISEWVRLHRGPVSVGGGRFSQGGQTATEGALQIDMRRFNKILEFRPQEKELTVQTGATWRDIQRFIDPHGLSVKVMQTYADFTVGGALSVNAHGRYVGLGPVVFSVKSIKVVLADGAIVVATPNLRPDVFFGAIGGYGGLGVIAEATLSLADNNKIAREQKLMPRGEYKDYFFKNVRDSKTAVLHNGDMYPPYDKVRAVTWSETEKPLTEKERLIPTGKSYRLDRLVIYLMMDRPWGMLYRRLADLLIYLRHPVVLRNHEAGYDVKELEPASRKTSTYVLQEYFIPAENFDLFAARMAEVLGRYRVNSMNVSVRHAKQDPGSLLAWAKSEVFAFVHYYKQGVEEHDKTEVGIWTRELIDAAVSLGGAYYLPYQIHATAEQFARAYPRATEYFALKATLDPENKFGNKLWDAYYPPNQAPARPLTERDGASNFRTVYGKTSLRDGFYRFLQNVFHLYPESRFHQLIWDAAKQGSDDRAIYEKVQAGLPGIKPFLAQLRLALPSLWKQKREMVEQTASLLGPGFKADGYVEIGTTGRYVKPLTERLGLQGPVYLLPLWTESGYSLEDVFERGGLAKVGKDVANMYDPIAPEDIPDASVDLVTVYVGLHHSPLKKLDGFVRSINRILRPGGRLVVRDHDVTTKDMDHFVGLAHDVYNGGLGMPWEENAKELRHFTSVDGLSAYLAGRGFKDSGKRILQDNDPTLNTLLEFVKTEDAPAPVNMKRKNRAAAMTYLTLPEWYIVYSAREYAESMRGAPSSFPYFGATAQYWSYYRKVVRLVKGKYPLSLGAHVMLGVIGASFSAENIVKGVYENTVGRLTGLLAFGRTQEDDYAQKVAREYADFVNLRPWYEFPYGKKLKELWSGTDFWGKGIVRKLERKAFLSMEYAVKSVYAKLIEKATHSAYAAEAVTTVAKTDNVPESLLKAEPRLQVLAQLDESTQAVALPRYGPFTEVAPRLAREGVRFKEIAGNDTILMTVLADRGWTASGGMGETVDEMPVLTEPKLKRVALRVRVESLSEALVALEKSGTSLEHIYDF